jgi:hypothetical protein
MTLWSMANTETWAHQCLHLVTRPPTIVIRRSLLVHLVCQVAHEAQSYFWLYWELGLAAGLL